MKYSLTTVASTVLTVLCLSGHSQGADNTVVNARNSINIYIGIIEYNINYERNIFQRPKSQSNLRIGFGNGKFFTAGEGYYLNPAFVYLAGAQNSHVEFNLGVKYMLTNSIEDPDFSEVCIPDIFLGYRFEKPSGGFVFRLGLNYPTLINIGIGYKF